MKKNEGFQTFIRKEEKDGVEYLHFIIKSQEVKVYPPMTFEISGFSAKKAHSYWKPAQMRNKNVVMCWGEGDKGDPVKGTLSAPTGIFYDLQGNNTLAAAYSNILEDTNFKMGVIEEKGELIVKIGLFPHKNKMCKEYSGTVRIDRRELPLEVVAADISKWYELENKPMKVPELAREAMYSTWYSYHQELTAADIEKEAKLAKEVGMKAIIVDDGWQTDDSNRGYAYCGDWEPSHRRIPDMKKHVEEVHKMGMKYLLWYSVPFLGIHSKAWDKFKDKILYMREELGAGVLDPRYREVREFLIGKYLEAVEIWEVDGLKLDFIDEFHQGKAQGSALLDDPERDFLCVQEGVEALMEETLNSLQKINSDILIEFRQMYIGPLMRKYGNIFRVCDCPLDFISNRMGIADLKFFSGNTAVHSDMIMWDPADTPEGAALQFASIIFGVPQFSMKMEELSKEHRKVIKFWLNLYNDNKKLFLDGEFKVKSPEYLYPLLTSENEAKLAIGVYQDKIVSLDTDKDIILVNGKLDKDIYLKLERGIVGEIVILNCMGEEVKNERIDLMKGINYLETPPCGVIKIKQSSVK